MKIAFVTANYDPFVGGVETHVREVVNHLAKSTCDFDVEVLTTDCSGRLPTEELVGGTRIRRFKSWAPNDSYYFSWSIREYLKMHSDSFDIVHAHSYHAFPAFFAAEAKGRNKLIFTPHYHGMGHTFFRSLLHKPYKLFGRKIFAKADRVVCVSRYERSLVLKNFDSCENKVVVIPNGVNAEEFRSLKRATIGSRQTILTVARLEEYKGVQYLISVLPRLSDDVALEVVGKGPYKSSLVKLSRRLGVAERVDFFQDLPRAELLQKYVDADLFCLLSNREAYSISVAEALVAGKCCIVANMSALAEWIDNKNCYGIDYPVDLDELQALVNTTLGKRAEGVHVPDWNDVMEDLIKLYSSVVDWRLRA